jgi:hypothetical protein
LRFKLLLVCGIVVMSSNERRYKLRRSTDHPEDSNAMYLLLCLGS